MLSSTILTKSILKHYRFTKNMLKNISIKKRLFILLSLIILSSILLGLWQYNRLSTINQSFKTYQQAAVMGEVNSLQISRDMNYCSRLTRSIMLGDNFDKNYKKLLQRIEDIKSSFSHLKNSVSSLDLKQRNTLIKSIEQSETDTMAFLNDGLRRMNNLNKTDRSQEIRNNAWKDYKATASPIANKARESFKELIKLEKQLKKQITIQTENTISQTQLYTAITMLISIIVMTTFTLLFAKSILMPLQHLKENIDYIEKNSDFTKRIELTSNDELSDVSHAFDRMLEKFQSALLEVQQAITQLSGSSTTLTQTAENTSHNIKQQQLEVNNISQVMQALDGTVQSIVDNTARGNKAVILTTEKSNNALAVVDQTISTINKLESDVSSASDMIHKLEQDTDSIGGVIDVIKSIAEQTNLLALNAAIEAARAGEQGRGFAVVADEVRTLASRTQESTAEIQEMIESLQSGSSAVVKVMSANQTQTSEVVKSASHTVDTINTINTSIDEVSQINSEITEITQQQSQSAQKMNQTIESINQLTDITSQYAEKNHHASQQLEALAGTLTNLITQFKIT